MKARHFLAKHPVIAALLYILVFGATATVGLLYLEANPIFVIIYDILIVLLSLVTQNAMAGAIMSKEVPTLFQLCDPYPLLAECEKLLTYKLGKDSRRVVTENYAAVLSAIGKYDEAVVQLEKINIDSENAIPEQKFVYYINYASALYGLGQIEKAEIMHLKADRIFTDSKNKRMKTRHNAAMEISRATYFYEKGDYDQAFAHLSTSAELSALNKVENAYLFGLVYLAKGISEPAKQNFLYAAQNGNKLHTATLANERLAEINKTVE